MAEALMPHGRGFTHRDHVYTAFHRYCFGVTRDPGAMKPHLALDAGFKGLLVEVVDAPSDAEFDALERTLRDDLLPEAIRSSSAGMVLEFWSIESVTYDQASTAAIAAKATINGQAVELRLRMAFWAVDGNVGDPARDEGAWSLAVWAPSAPTSRES